MAVTVTRACVSARVIESTARVSFASPYAISPHVVSWSSPGAIGGTTPNTGAFTSITASGRITGNGGIRVIGDWGLGASDSAGVMSYASAVTRSFIGDGTGYSWRFSKRASSTTTDLVTITDAGNVGIGTDPTSVPSTGNPVVGAGNLIMYNAGNIGLTMLTDNAATRTQQIGFGSQGINLFDAGFKYDNSNRKLELWAGGAVKGYLDSSGNLGVGTSTFGTSAAGVLGIANGTAPSTGVADTVQFYSSDDAAGHTIPSFYCEGTNVVATGQADSASSVRVKMRINGTVRTFLCI